MSTRAAVFGGGFVTKAESDVYHVPYRTSAERETFRALNERCGGFCGYPYKDDNVVGFECGACGRGALSDGWVCLPCEDELSAYDILFLFFFLGGVWITQMVVLIFTIRDDRLPKKHSSRRLKRALLLLSVFLESLISAICTSLSFKDYGSLFLRGCPMNGLHEWYGLVGFRSMECVYEVVYPRLTYPLVYFTYSVVFIIILRAPLSFWFCNNAAALSIYVSLWGFPIAAILAILLGGIIYYSFPFTVLVVNVLAEVFLFARFGRQIVFKINSLERGVTLVRYLVYCFAIVSLYREERFNLFPYGWLLLMLSFAPSIAFVCTAGFSDPKRSILEKPF